MAVGDGSAARAAGSRRVGSAGGRRAAGAGSSGADPAFRAILRAAGLAQYVRKLEEMGYGRMARLLRLGRGEKLEGLLANLRFLPGHRLKFVNMLEEERARAQQEAVFEGAALFYAGGRENTKPTPSRGQPAARAASGQARGNAAGRGRGSSTPAPSRGHSGRAQGRHCAPAAVAGSYAEVEPSQRVSSESSRSSPPEEPPIDAESAAIAFFQLSWVKEMLAAKDDGANALFTLQEESGGEEEESGLLDNVETPIQAPVDEAAAALQQVQLGSPGGASMAEDYEDDFESEDEAAAPCSSPIKLSKSTTAGTSGDLANPPAGGADTLATLAGKEAETVQQAMLRVLEQRAEAEAASQPRATSIGMAESPAAVGGPRLAVDGRSHSKGGLLSNSMGSFAPPSGVPSRPHHAEVVEAVAFVLAKQIEEEGRVLLLRTRIGKDDEESSPRDADGELATSASALRVNETAVSNEEQEVAAGIDASSSSSAESDGSESDEPDLPGSPPPSAGFCRALLRAQDALNGLRYSLELSPIIEAHKHRGGRSSVHASIDSIADPEVWARGWKPPESLRSLFDEALHPLPFDIEGRQIEVSSGPLEWSNPTVGQVSTFLRQIAIRAQMGAEASVVGLAYVERLVSISGRPLDARSWRRAVLAAWLLAAKMWDDDCFESQDFAHVLSLDGALPARSTESRVPACPYVLPCKWLMTALASNAYASEPPRLFS